MQSKQAKPKTVWVQCALFQQVGPTEVQISFVLKHVLVVAGSLRHVEKALCPVQGSNPGPFRCEEPVLDSLH